MTDACIPLPGSLVATRHGVQHRWCSRCVSCEGCLVVITDHGPQAEVARVFGHELLVDSGEGRLESLEEERQKREEKEIGEENNQHTQRTDDHACMSDAR